MIPDHFYMTNLGIIVYAALYLPVVLIFLWSLWRQTKSFWKLTAPLGLVLITLPFWDVYMIGRDADRLCSEQAGLHVYKTVEADSFRGGGNIVKLSKYGFVYAESYGVGGKVYRRKVIDGQLDRKVVGDFSTRYEIGGRGYQVISKSIASNALQTVDLEKKEVLGELVTLNIHPGIFDGVLLKFVSSGPVLWHCGEEPPTGRTEPLGFDDLILATLKPISSEGDSR